MTVVRPAAPRDGADDDGDHRCDLRSMTSPDLLDEVVATDPRACTSRRFAG
jgi:hypothetical protein